MPTTDPVPSSSPLDLLFNAEKIDEAVSSSALQYTDRLGVMRMTLAGATASIAAINDRGAWATATLYAAKDLVKDTLDTNAWFVCVEGHTSDASLAADSTYWRLYAGVQSFDLSADEGAGLVGFDETYVGYGAGTVGARLREFSSTAGASVGAGLVADDETLSYLDGTVGFALRQIRERQQINLLDYVTPQTVAERENVRTGVSDCDAAFAAALTASYLRNNATIHVPCGVYRKNGKTTITQGTMICCEGSQGSNQAYGTSFIHYSTGDCFEWTGGGADFTGTGGGLTNCLIVKADTYQGGEAIKVTATSDNKRPGEMVFDNVLVYGIGSTVGAGGTGGLWARCLNIDGTACNTPGARGVRTVVMRKCRFAEATTANETVVLNQVTHFYSDGLQIDTGDASAAQGLTIKGINDGVYMSSSGIGGNLIITANDANNQLNNFHFDGKIAAVFDNDDDQVNGTLRASFSETAGYTLLNRSKSLKCTTNINPAFTLANAVTDTNVTGNGTIYNVAFDTDQQDQGNNFGAMPATDFNCSCAGNYKFSANVLLSSIAAGHTRADVYIAQTGSVTRTYTALINAAAVAAGGLVSMQITSPVMSLAYGDVVKVRVVASGSTLTVGVFGDVTFTWFSGAYLPT